MQYGRYTEDISRLDITADMFPDGCRWPPDIRITSDLFEVILDDTENKQRLHIDQSGHVWTD